MNDNPVYKFIDSCLMFIIKPVAITLSLPVAGMFTLGIFTRIVIGSPMFGLEELVLLCVMWLYMLGAILASRERAHLAADFILVITKNVRIISFMNLLATVISLIIAIFFITWSYDLLVWGIQKRQETPVFNFPWYFSQGSLFFASLFMVFYLLRDTVNDFQSFVNSNKEGAC